MLSIIWRVWKLELFPVSGVEVMRDSYLLGPLEGATQWRKHAEFPKCCVQRDLRLWTLFEIQVMYIGIYCCQKCLYLGMTDFILRIYVAVTNSLAPSTVIACACMWAYAYACMHILYVCVCARACMWVSVHVWLTDIHSHWGWHCEVVTFYKFVLNQKTMKSM